MHLLNFRQEKRYFKRRNVSLQNPLEHFISYLYYLFFLVNQFFEMFLSTGICPEKTVCGRIFEANG